MVLRRSLMAVLLWLGLVGSASAEFLIGYAFVGGVNGLNLEWAARRHTLYVVPGMHLGDAGLDEEFRWVAGSRYRIDRGFTNTSGFYTGLMVGDLGGERAYERLGLGFEIGHQWVKEYVRSTVSVGFAALEEMKCGDYLPASSCSGKDADANHKDVEPKVVLGVTISLRR